MKNKVTLAIEIEDAVYQEMPALCKKAGTTVEILIESFIRYCAVPENLPIVRAYLQEKATQDEAAAADQVSMEVVTAVFAMAAAESRRREGDYSDEVTKDQTAGRADSVLL